jgi:hypothetical protein
MPGIRYGKTERQLHLVFAVPFEPYSVETPLYKHVIFWLSYKHAVLAGYESIRRKRFKDGSESCISDIE